MTKEQFWNKFLSLFEEGSESLSVAQDNWNNKKKFTKLFVNDYIRKIINENNSQTTQREYFRIDITSYKNRKEEAKKIAKELNLDNCGIKQYLWELEVALEHENNSSEWIDEVIKLSFINCPLRVVIGYTDLEKRDNCLKLAAALLKERIGNNTPKGQSFIVILGKSGIKGSQVNKSTYKAYEYKNAEFKEMK